MSQITSNPLITSQDIRTNPALWKQKISLIFFVDENKKPYWTKDYNFIPHFERYNQVAKWIRETEFPLYNCRIIENGNNQIEIITQNFFGERRLAEEKEQELLIKIRKIIYSEIKSPSLELEPGAEQDISQMIENYRKELKEGLKLETYEVLNNFAHKNLFSSELNQLKAIQKEETKLINYDLGRPDLAIIWRKQLYFISSFDYINNYKLFVQIRAKKCLLYLYYWNWLKSAGIGVLDKAPVIQDKDHRHHYDFCGELGIKRTYQQSFQSYQPKFALFKAINAGEVDKDLSEEIMGGSKFTWSEQKGEKAGHLEIPSEVALEKVIGRNIQFDRELGSLWSSFSAKKIFTGKVISSLVKKLLSNRIFLTIGPDELEKKTNYYQSLWSDMKMYEEVLFTKSPNDSKWFKERPHLWDHTTFQFYLFNNITMSANGRYLGIKEKDGQFILPYKLFINFAPGNLYYRWEFKNITVKCEVSCETQFEDLDNPLKYITNVSIHALTFGGGLSWNADQKKPSWHVGEPKAEQEANTDRKFKSTYRGFNDKIIEPSMFNANTIDFHYSLGEFFNRLTTPVFFFRIEYSELLYNRLGWANNKQKTAISNLPIQWNNLVSFSQGSKDKKKLGWWRWREVMLESDNNNFFTNLMRKGYWLTDGSKLTNPNFTEQKGHDLIEVGGNAWDITQAEEEITERREWVEEELMKADTSNADYSNVDYIGSPDSELWSQIDNQITKNKHPGSNPMPNLCLGCLLGGGSHHSNYKGNQTFTWHLTTGGNVYLKTRGDGTQKCEIPPQGGTLIFKEENGTARLIFGEDKLFRDVKVKETKTQTQEIDEEELIVKEDEFEDEIEEILNEEEIDQEEGLGGVGDHEKEREHEEEIEEEEESEEEQEVEDETEKEKEQEDEKEVEKESEKESEGESEDENENEEEEEIEL